MVKKYFLVFILGCFFTSSVIGTCHCFAQEFHLPDPGTMVSLSPFFNPPILKGLKVYPYNPFKFDFIFNHYQSFLARTDLPHHDNGGIDLSSDKALTVQNSVPGIKFHFDPAQLRQWQQATGIIPIIINIQPLKDLKSFLGVNAKIVITSARKRIKKLHRSWKTLLLCRF
jgi:hypothetical protein